MDEQPIRIKDEAVESKNPDDGASPENGMNADIIEETPAHSDGAGSGITQQQQQYLQQQQSQQQRHSSSGKASTTSSSNSNGALEINTWESASSSGGGVGGVDNVEFMENGAGGMDDGIGDYYAGRSGAGRGMDADGFGFGNAGDELELMNLLNANLSSQKIHTLKCIAPHNACVKGTPENRLSTSLCYDFGKG